MRGLTLILGALLAAVFLFSGTPAKAQCGPVCYPACVYSRPCAYQSVSYCYVPAYYGCGYGYYGGSRNAAEVQCTQTGIQALQYDMLQAQYLATHGYGDDPCLACRIASDAARINCLARGLAQRD